MDDSQHSSTAAQHGTSKWCSIAFRIISLRPLLQYAIGVPSCGCMLSCASCPPFPSAQQRRTLQTRMLHLLLSLRRASRLALKKCRMMEWNRFYNRPQHNSITAWMGGPNPALRLCTAQQSSAGHKPLLSFDAFRTSEPVSVIRSIIRSVIRGRPVSRSVTDHCLTDRKPSHGPPPPISSAPLQYSSTHLLAGPKRNEGMKGRKKPIERRSN